MKYEKIDAFPNDCILYWKSFIELTIYPTCEVPRYKLDKQPTKRVGILRGPHGKKKDGLAARVDLVEMKLRAELAPTEKKNRTYLPPACYTLSKEEKKKVCSSLEGMKQLLPVAIRGVLPKHVRHSIPWLCFFFNHLCGKVVDVSKLDVIQKEMVTTLCLLEKYFPPLFFDIMVHLMVHLVREVRLCGLVWYKWMCSFERFMKILKGYVRNRNWLKGCIAECYIAKEVVEFCSEYLFDIRTVGIPSSLHETEDTKPTSGAQVDVASQEEWEQAHLYMLTNDAEVDPYIEEHMAYLKASNPKKAKGKWLQDEHNRTFISWFHGHAIKVVAQPNHQISERLKWLAQDLISRCCVTMVI